MNATGTPAAGPTARTIFWGRSVQQAIAKAARHFGVAVERLAYRIHPKRHGFVRQPRTVLIEVDPTALERAIEAPISLPEAGRAPASTPMAPSPERQQPPRPGRAPRPAAYEPGEESWDLPDEESELAAREAIGRILRFAGIEATVAVRSAGDRLEVELLGVDAPGGGGGVDWPEAVEQLLPRAIVTLSGRRVRCRLDLGGRRAAREAELRQLALDCAARVRASGQAELLEPLPAAERRLVHLALAEASDLATESLGSGYEKRIQVSPRTLA